MHVAARALAGQALSIFGDHSDVMACRSTGWAMLASESVEMVQYNALVSHLVSMERRVPVQHFFDGFRTSHEVNKVKLVDYSTMKAQHGTAWHSNRISEGNAQCSQRAAPS